MGFWRRNPSSQNQTATFDHAYHVVELNIPAEHRFLNVVGSCVEALFERMSNVPEREIKTYNTQLAVHEICTNIVNHAYKDIENGRIQVLFFLDEDAQQLEINLYDYGGRFDPSSVREPNLDEPQVHGYGLFLVRQLVDEVVYTPEASRNHWRLVVKW